MSKEQKGTTRHNRFDDAINKKSTFEVKYIKVPMTLGIILIAGLIVFRSMDIGNITEGIAHWIDEVINGSIQEVTVTSDPEVVSEEIYDDVEEAPIDPLIEELLYDGPLQLGLTMPQVLAILGDPYSMDVDGGEYRYWFYADDEFTGEYYPTISFDINNFVDGWYNYEGWFDAVMLEPSMNGELIIVGITAEEVYQILGTPDYIESDSQMFLWYKDMYIELSEVGKVIGWRYRDYTLDGFFQMATGELGDIAIGLSDVEVTSILGAPNDLVIVEGEVIWLYGESSITFNMDSQVIGWYDEGELILMRKIAEGDSSQLTVGMLPAEVEVIIGTPKYTFYEESNIWGYDSMYAEFDENDVLVAWGPWSE